MHDLENMIKMKNILLILPLFGLIIIILLAIIKFRNDNLIKINNYEIENEIIINTFEDENYESKKIELKNLDDDNIENIENKSLESYKKNKNEKIIIINEIDLTYYTQENWYIEEKVIKEEKQKISFFERLDGKVPKVTKRIKKYIKWLKNPNDKKSYVKNEFLFIPTDFSNNIIYKYYFDENGYLITDNISKDLTILDRYGREIDDELMPINYYLDENDENSKEDVRDVKEDIYYSYYDININSTPSQIIIPDGVKLKKTSQNIFDNLMDRNMSNYIVSGSGYHKNAKGTITTKNKWKDAIKLKGNESYIIFNNHKNNFNRITGKVAMEYAINTDNDINTHIIFYDKEEYDKGNVDDYLYIVNSSEIINVNSFSFTFDRTIKNIIAVLYDNRKIRNIYFKDLRYGFSKSAYKNELIRKKEEQEEIDYLKSLGIYIEDENEFNTIEEDGEIYEKEIIYQNLEKNNDYVLDSGNGPYFDKEINKKNNMVYGPYFEIVGTSSEIKEKNKKSKIIYTK